MEVLPAVAAENCFALKGGTAINFFLRDLPRLSVDIDLAYLPINDYETSRQEIDQALRRIREWLIGSSPPYEVVVGDNDCTGLIDTLSVRSLNVQVKIEVNPVLRGVLHPTQSLAVRPIVEEQIGFTSWSKRENGSSRKSTPGLATGRSNSCYQSNSCDPHGNCWSCPALTNSPL